MANSIGYNNRNSCFYSFPKINESGKEFFYEVKDVLFKGIETAIKIAKFALKVLVTGLMNVLEPLKYSFFTKFEASQNSSKSNVFREYARKRVFREYARKRGWESQGS